MLEARTEPGARGEIISILVFTLLLVKGIADVDILMGPGDANLPMFDVSECTYGEFTYM